MKANKLTKETIHTVGIVDKEMPAFAPGDKLVISQRIKEGDKERIQLFEGDVIAIKKNGNASTFTVRKIGAHSVAVERIFPLYSPLIKEIKVIKKGDVRRAKLYYVRTRVGKATRFKERIEKREERSAIE